MVCRLSALRDEAEAAGFSLLTYLIEVALVEAERIAEARREPVVGVAAGAETDAIKDGTPGK